MANMDARWCWPSAHVVPPRQREAYAPDVREREGCYSAREDFCICQAVRSWMKSIDRSSALAEAQFSALEAFILLVRADGTDDMLQERVEEIREALGAARALVVAASCALSQSADHQRTAAHVNSQNPSPKNS